MLSSDQIEKVHQSGDFIDPFKPEKLLKPASYELTVGDEWCLGGEYFELGVGDAKNFIEIPPFQVAVLKTEQTLCIPRFLIARWNIKIQHVYQGLLWVGAPQVDPGYVGKLFCPIYNLSNRKIRIGVGEPFAQMDFVKTTGFQPSISKSYKFPPKRLIIEDYEVHNLQSALFTEVKQKFKSYEEQFEQIKKDLKSTETRLGTFTTFVLGVLAVLVSTLAIFVGFDGRPSGFLDFRATVSLILGAAVFSLSLSLFHYVASKGQFEKKRWRYGIWLAVVFGVAVTFANLGGIGWLLSLSNPTSG